MEEEIGKEARRVKKFIDIVGYNLVRKVYLINVLMKRNLNLEFSSRMSGINGG